MAHIATSSADIGIFPFINLPKGLKEMNKPLLSEYEVCFFPLAGVMTPVEGRLYKTYISAERGQNFSQHYFEKSMAEYLSAIGAIKVFDGEISKTEYERFHRQDPNKGSEGDIGYAGQNIKFWILRSPAQGNIYIQYHADNASAALNVMQVLDFEQTIRKVTAAQISEELNDAGKAIVYINFKPDESEITADGQLIVQPIVEALKQQDSLHIAIEGHTDRTGDPEHNKRLSDERARAVMSALSAHGINQSRLSARGFGSDSLLVRGTSVSDHEKNRRVELRRIN
ncbi:OmpA family protein [Sphingobacterium hotanense]|uniref:OmpA family protein n=1 Tax=Sphingobacterium hotanense TaxID=649196 RepID=UPI0011F1F5A0|nr:OmpA family protein [Sphingobacterium hotanense]